MSDPETLDAYATKARDYAELVSRDTPDRDLQRFINALPKGAKVLDLGCGPGNSAAMMRDAGLEIEATDASAEMIVIARDRFGIDAKLSSFDDLDAQDVYEGIWANFSLLHARRADMPRYLDALRAALKPSGLLHLGLKLGEGEERDDIGRFYTYYTEDELTGLLNDAGLALSFTRQGKADGMARTDEPFIIINAHA